MPTINIHHTISLDPAVMTQIMRLASAIETQLPLLRKFNKMSAELDTAITDLQGDLQADTDVVSSATALMSQLNQMLADAIAAANAAGATPAELQSLSDLHAAWSAKSQELAAAVAANTPAGPTP